jgi:hypothetical protein
MAKPVIYDLRNDADAKRFGLTPDQRDQYMEGCFRDRSGARPRAIFCHVQEGTTRSSLKWAIEKPGSQNSYSYTVQMDGSILTCIPERHGPWTNGAVRKPKAKAKKLLDLGGNPNLYAISIEVEGYSTGEHPDVQIESVIWLVRDISRRHTIQILGDDSAGDWLFEHADVDTVERSTCAGWYYDVVQKAIRAGGEVKPPVAQYAPPAIVPALSRVSLSDVVAPAVVRVNGTDWIWVGDRVVATRDTPRLQYADPKAAVVGPPIRKGEFFNVDWLCFHKGEFWYLTQFGTRVRRADTERVSDQKAA